VRESKRELVKRPLFFVTHSCTTKPTWLTLGARSAGVRRKSGLTAIATSAFSAAFSA
jgi:hypothetical protein